MDSAPVIPPIIPPIIQPLSLADSSNPRLTTDDYYPIWGSEDRRRSTPFTPGSTPWVPPPGFIPQTFEPSASVADLQPGPFIPPLADDYSDIGTHV